MYCKRSVLRTHLLLHHETWRTDYSESVVCKWVGFTGEGLKICKIQEMSEYGVNRWKCVYRKNLISCLTFCTQNTKISLNHHIPVIFTILNGLISYLLAHNTGFNHHHHHLKEQTVHSPPRSLQYSYSSLPQQIFPRMLIWWYPYSL